MIYLLLDILIYNFTSHASYFFLINISTKDFFYNLVIALIIDLFIMHTYFINTLIIVSLYLIKKYLLKLNLNNFFTYSLYNSFNFFSYFLLMSLIFKNINLSSLILIYLFNLIFIMISYKNKRSNISLIG